MNWPPQDVPLEGEMVRLEPLVEAHRAPLRSVAGHAEVWEWIDRRVSTSYLAPRPLHDGVEIGWTWLTPAAWGTGANIEAKLLMLGFAFDSLDCMRVELKTDARNVRSRGAMEALPAKFEGVLRKHMLVPVVGIRDSAYFSVLDDEWPEVRENLRRRHAAAGEGKSA